MTPPRSYFYNSLMGHAKQAAMGSESVNQQNYLAAALTQPNYQASQRSHKIHHAVSLPINLGKRGGSI